MNDIYFSDLVKGIFGRKIAYTNYETVSRDNIVSVLGETIGIFNFNKGPVKYLWDYHKGDQPGLYRKKKNAARDDILNMVVENHAYELVRFKNQQTYGEPIQYVSRGKDDEISKNVDTFIKYLEDAFKHTRDVESGEWQSAVGTSFKCVQIAKNNIVPFRIVIPTPLETYVVYQKSTKEPVVAVQEIWNEKKERMYQCFTNSECFIIQNGKVISSSVHAFGGIPIVEFPNNAARLSDVELVITILDAVNNLQANRIDSVEAFVKSWIKFVNCSIDQETFEKMKLSGALVVKSNNGENKADVDIINQELSQSEAQVAKDDLINSMYSILAIPNKEGGGSKGGDSQGAVELRAGWDFSKGAARLKDPFVVEAEKRLAVCILNIIRIYNDDCPITVRDFDVKVMHSPLDNAIVKVQVLDFLLKNGIHPKVAFEVSGFFPDAEKAYQLSKPYLDVLFHDINSDDPDTQMKRANLFSALMNAGATPEMAQGISKLYIANSPNMAKWKYELDGDNDV
jgi:SPP1 family phage portal protein